MKIIQLFLFAGAGSPQAARKLMALSEPGKTRPRKTVSSVQIANRTSSVSSYKSTHSNSSLKTASKSSPTDQTMAPGRSASTSNSSRTITSMSTASTQGSHPKSHERSKSDVTSVKLSAESSSVTSLHALRKGAPSSSKFTYLIIKF